MATARNPSGGWSGLDLMVAARMYARVGGHGEADVLKAYDGAMVDYVKAALRRFPEHADDPAEAARRFDAELFGGHWYGPMGEHGAP